MPGIYVSRGGRSRDVAAADIDRYCGGTDRTSTRRRTGSGISSGDAGIDASVVTVTCAVIPTDAAVAAPCVR